MQASVLVARIPKRCASRRSAARAEARRSHWRVRVMGKSDRVTPLPTGSLPAFTLVKFSDLVLRSDPGFNPGERLEGRPRAKAPPCGCPSRRLALRARLLRTRSECSQVRSRAMTSRGEHWQRCLKQHAARTGRRRPNRLDPILNNSYDYLSFCLSRAPAPTWLSHNGVADAGLFDT